MPSPQDKNKDEHQHVVIDNVAYEETVKKDKLLAAEIDNLLDSTKVPDFKKLDVVIVVSNELIVSPKASTSFTAAELSPSGVSTPTSIVITPPTSLLEQNTSSDGKIVPIKEKGKRIFKSRNRSRNDEMPVTTPTTL